MTENCILIECEDLVKIYHRIYLQAGNLHFK